MELRAPFGYLHSLVSDGAKTASQSGLQGEENKTSRAKSAGSNPMSIGVPEDKNFEVFSSLNHAPFVHSLTEFLEQIAYPQCVHLARFLTSV
jgi:hypothetical protein